MRWFSGRPLITMTWPTSCSVFFPATKKKDRHLGDPLFPTTWLSPLMRITVLTTMNVSNFFCGFPVWKRTGESNDSLNFFSMHPWVVFQIEWINNCLESKIFYLFPRYLSFNQRQIYGCLNDPSRLISIRFIAEWCCGFFWVESEPFLLIATLN